MPRPTASHLLLTFVLLSVPVRAPAQEVQVEFSRFEEGTTLSGELGHRGLLLASSENLHGPQVQIEPDLQAVLVPSLAAPPVDSPVETISLFFVDPRDGSSPAVTSLLRVVTDVGPGNAAMLEGFGADGRLLGVTTTGPTGGPRAIEMTADGIASGRFTATFNGAARGCIGAIGFTEPVPIDSR